MQNKGVLLINLGSPDSTEVKDVKRYLDEFLMDKNVIDVPWLLRALIVKGIILNTRPPKSAEAYSKIWSPEGSPLIVTTDKVTKKVDKKLDMPVEMAMRYGNPSINNTISKMVENHPQLNELIVVPLYPHYAMSSYGTVVEKTEEVVKENFPELELNFVQPFYDHDDYIRILAESIKPYTDKPYDYILFSYHGLPVRHLKKSDITKSHCYKVDNCCSVDSEAHQFCYKHQVVRTTDLVADKLGIPKDKYSLAFQSRLGADEWIKPETDATIEELAKSGVKNMLIVCPAFVADCLETLEEIGMEAKETFIENGGEEFTMIPCLNERDSFAQFMVDQINVLANSEDKVPA